LGDGAARSEAPAIVGQGTPLILERKRAEATSSAKGKES